MPAVPWRTARPGRSAAIVTLLFGCGSGAAEPAAETLQQQFEQRLASLATADLPGRAELAAWAAQRNLHDHAERLYRQLLLHDPNDDEAYRSLLRLASDRELPADSDSYRAAHDLLPQRFIDLHTKHFVVISDASPRWTRTQAELLQRAHHQFHRFTRRLGLRPLPLRHKLVCVLFERREDYRNFAEHHDGVIAEWISGYYSPRHDRVVFYDIQSDGGVAGAGHRRQPMPAVITATSRTADPGLRAAIATTVHEATHQLMFHTGIQSPQIENPLWISEGLATAFETDSPNGAFGPDRDYAARREQFRTLLANDQLIPLRDLVQYTEMPDDRDETLTAVYHQSYALVVWMSRFRKRELRSYLNALRSEPAGRPTANRHLELFEQAFGNVNRLEQTWLRHERNHLDRVDARPAPAGSRCGAGVN